MNIYRAKFKSKDLCVLIVDDTDKYTGMAKEVVKNRADYTITNVTGMGYDVWVDTNVDKMLNAAANNYTYAVVISAATEFTQGETFFAHHPVFDGILGHILDGGDAYYGLHYQCYSVNLKNYKKLGSPAVGQDQPFASHKQIAPFRSHDNLHDDYLPYWINMGTMQMSYKHKIHGWNLISSFLSVDLPVEAYGEIQRNSKHYIYREELDSYAFQKYNYCLTQHVHTKATGQAAKYPRKYNTPIKYLITIANQDAALKRLNGHDAEIIYYDYNQRALDTVGGGHLIDPLHSPEDLLEIIPTDDPHGTVVDLSNIFAYEGSAAVLPLKYRLQQENKLINLLQEHLPHVTVIFDKRAAEGIYKWKPETGTVKDLRAVNWEDLDLPSWHR